MEKPKCKLCGERHYGICAVSPDPIPPTNLQITPTKKEKFDRNKYQRELMRKRRAQAKENKGEQS